MWWLISEGWWLIKGRDSSLYGMVWLSDEVWCLNIIVWKVGLIDEVWWLILIVWER